MTMVIESTRVQGGTVASFNAAEKGGGGKGSRNEERLIMEEEDKR